MATQYQDEIDRITRIALGKDSRFPQESVEESEQYPIYAFPEDSENRSLADNRPTGSAFGDSIVRGGLNTIGLGATGLAALVSDGTAQYSAQDTDPDFERNFGRFVGQYESGNNPNAIANHSPDSRVSQNTVSENARLFGNAGLGIWQIQRDTALDTLKKRGLNPDTYVFNKQGQQYLFNWLLQDRAGLDDYKHGIISPEEFAHNVSKTWAALPRDGSNKSYYEGESGNKAGTTWGSVLAKLNDSTKITKPKNKFVSNLSYLADTAFAEAAKYPTRIPTTDDIHNVEDLATYVVEAVGENAFDVVGTLMSGGLGLKLAKQLGAHSAEKQIRNALGNALTKKQRRNEALARLPQNQLDKLSKSQQRRAVEFRKTLPENVQKQLTSFEKGGMLAGAGTYNYTVITGEQYNQYIQHGFSPEVAARLATIAAIPATGMDLLGFGTVFNKLVKATKKSPTSVLELVSNVAKATGVGAIAEGSTEALQQIISYLAIKYEDPSYQPFSAENKKELFEVAAKAMAGGGGIAGGISTTVGTVQYGANKLRDTASFINKSINKESESIDIGSRLEELESIVKGGDPSTATDDDVDRHAKSLNGVLEGFQQLFNNSPKAYAKVSKYFKDTLQKAMEEYELSGTPEGRKAILNTMSEKILSERNRIFAIGGMVNKIRNLRTGVKPTESMRRVIDRLKNRFQNPSVADSMSGMDYSFIHGNIFDDVQKIISSDKDFHTKSPDEIKEALKRIFIEQATPENGKLEEFQIRSIADQVELAFNDTTISDRIAQETGDLVNQSPFYSIEQLQEDIDAGTIPPTFLDRSTEATKTRIQEQINLAENAFFDTTFFDGRNFSDDEKNRIRDAVKELLRTTKVSSDALKKAISEGTHFDPNATPETILEQIEQAQKSEDIVERVLTTAEKNSTLWKYLETEVEEEHLNKLLNNYPELEKLYVGLRRATANLEAASKSRAKHKLVETWQNKVQASKNDISEHSDEKILRTKLEELTRRKFLDSAGLGEYAAEDVPEVDLTAEDYYYNDSEASYGVLARPFYFGATQKGLFKELTTPFAAHKLSPISGRSFKEILGEYKNASTERRKELDIELKSLQSDSIKRQLEKLKALHPDFTFRIVPARTVAEAISHDLQEKTDFTIPKQGDAEARIDELISSIIDITEKYELESIDFDTPESIAAQLPPNKKGTHPKADKAQINKYAEEITSLRNKLSKNQGRRSVYEVETAIKRFYQKYNIPFKSADLQILTLNEALTYDEQVSTEDLVEYSRLAIEYYRLKKLRANTAKYDTGHFIEATPTNPELKSSRLVINKGMIEKAFDIGAKQQRDAVKGYGSDRTRNGYINGIPNLEGELSPLNLMEIVKIGLVDIAKEQGAASINRFPSSANVYEGFIKGLAILAETNKEHMPNGINDVLDKFTPDTKSKILWNYRAESGYPSPTYNSAKKSFYNRQKEFGDDPNGVQNAFKNFKNNYSIKELIAVIKGEETTRSSKDIANEVLLTKLYDEKKQVHQRVADVHGSYVPISIHENILETKPFEDMDSFFTEKGSKTKYEALNRQVEDAERLIEQPAITEAVSAGTRTEEIDKARLRHRLRVVRSPIGEVRKLSIEDLVQEDLEHALTQTELQELQAAGITLDMLVGITSEEFGGLSIHEINEKTGIDKARASEIKSLADSIYYNDPASGSTVEQVAPYEFGGWDITRAQIPENPDHPFYQTAVKINEYLDKISHLITEGTKKEAIVNLKRLAMDALTQYTLAKQASNRYIIRVPVKGETGKYVITTSQYRDADLDDITTDQFRDLIDQDSWRRDFATTAKKIHEHLNKGHIHAAKAELKNFRNMEEYSAIDNLEASVNEAFRNLRARRTQEEINGGLDPISIAETLWEDNKEAQLKYFDPSTSQEEKDALKEAALINASKRGENFKMLEAEFNRAERFYNNLHHTYSKLTASLRMTAEDEAFIGAEIKEILDSLETSDIGSDAARDTTSEYNDHKEREVRTNDSKIYEDLEEEEITHNKWASLQTLKKETSATFSRFGNNIIRLGENSKEIKHLTGLLTQLLHATKSKFNIMLVDDTGLKDLLSHSVEEAVWRPTLEEQLEINDADTTPERKKEIYAAVADRQARDTAFLQLPQSQQLLDIKKRHEQYRSQANSMEASLLKKLAKKANDKNIHILNETYTDIEFGDAIREHFPTLAAQWEATNINLGKANTELNFHPEEVRRRKILKNAAEGTKRNKYYDPAIAAQMENALQPNAKNHAHVFYAGDHVVIHIGAMKHLDTKTRKLTRVLALGHEFGHAFMRAAFKDAPLHVQKELYDAYKATMADWDDKGYGKYAFREWFADQVATWVLGSGVKKYGRPIIDPEEAARTAAAEESEARTENIVFGASNEVASTEEESFKRAFVFQRDVLNPKLQAFFNKLVAQLKTLHEFLQTKTGFVKERFTSQRNFSSYMEGMARNKDFVESDFTRPTIYELTESDVYDSSELASAAFPNDDINEPPPASPGGSDENYENFQYQLVANFNARNQPGVRNMFAVRGRAFLNGTYRAVLPIFAASQQLRAWGKSNIAETLGLTSQKASAISRQDRKGGLPYKDAVTANMRRWGALYESVLPSNVTERRSILEQLQYENIPDAQLSAEALKVREVHRKFAAYLSSRIPDFRPVENHFHRVYNKTKIADEPEAFIAFVQARLPHLPPQKIRQIKDTILGDSGVDLDPDILTSPTNEAIKERKELGNIPTDDFATEGWLHSDPEYAFFTGVNKAIRRAEIGRLYGRSIINPATGSSYFDPTYDLREEIAAMPDGMAKQRVTKIVQGVFGQRGRHMDSKWRQYQNNIMAVESWLTLLFSGIASIPEFTGPILRSKDLAGASAAMSKIKENIRNRQEASDRYEAMGFLEQQLATQSMVHVYGLDAEPSWAFTSNKKLFKLNGQQFVTDLSRVWSASIAEDFILRHGVINRTAQSDAYLKELDLSPEIVRQWNDLGKPLWNKNQDGSVNLNQSAQANYVAGRIQDAISVFVDQSIVNPHNLQKPVFMSDPRFALFTHLKTFFYAYQHTVLEGIWNNMKQRNGLTPKMVPIAIAAMVTLPASAASLELRELLQYWGSNPPSNRMDFASYMHEITSRAGGYGMADLGFAGLEARSTAHLAGTFGGPTVGHVATLLSDPERGLYRSIPIVAQVPALQRAF